jgi:hypothetical protein
MAHISLPSLRSREASEPQRKRIRHSRTDCFLHRVPWRSLLRTSPLLFPPLHAHARSPPPPILPHHAAQLGVRGPADCREHVPVSDAHLKRVRLHPPPTDELDDEPQAKKHGAPDSGHGARSGEQELAVAREHDGPARPHEHLHQCDCAAVALRDKRLHEPAAQDDQRVIARRVRRGLCEVGGDREPRVVGELGVQLEADVVLQPS